MRDLERGNMNRDEFTSSIIDFFPTDAPVAEYGNQFVRHESGGKTGGTIEFNTPANSAPANAQLFFVVGVPKDIKGMSDGGDQMTLIFKENHGAPGKRDGRYNVKVRIDYQDGKSGQPAFYTGNVELGVEDNHDKDTNPKELKGVIYQNTNIIKKYKTGSDPVKLKGSYQDTPDGGLRIKLEVQDPEDGEWKKLFDHVDFGDKNHDIKNYRGKSAFRSSIRIDGNCPDFNGKPLNGLKSQSINIQKTPEAQKQLDNLAFGNITFKEIGPDDGKWTDGVDDPLSFGKKQN